MANPLSTLRGTLAVAADVLCLALASVAVAQPGDGPARPPTPTPVAPVVVQPETPAKPKIVATTDAAPLTSPDYTDKDAQAELHPPLAVVIAPNTALGRQTLQNGSPGGLLGANPELHGGSQSVIDGVTVVF